MSTPLALIISVILLALNGFFVAAEFALVASKRHRLEEAAAAGSRSARAAIAGVSELSLMLAGAQLGITLCTLGLGSLAEPAVASLLHPLFELAHVPERVGHVIALIIAVAVIGLLHVLLGEMAPKSWAISNPGAVGAGARSPVPRLHLRLPPAADRAELARQPLRPAGRR